MKLASVVSPFALFLFCLIEWTLGVLYIPMRTEVTYVNEKYAYNGSAYITRYGRKSPYYYNLQAGILHTWGNNITLNLVFFEGQNNQFKRNFFEIHLKLCDLLQRDPYFGKTMGTILARHEIGCPAPPGMYRLHNLTMPSEHMPNVLPFLKGKVEVTFTQLPTNDVVTTLYVIFMIKEKENTNIRNTV